MELLWSFKLRGKAFKMIFNEKASVKRIVFLVESLSPTLKFLLVASKLGKMKVMVYV